MSKKTIPLKKTTRRAISHEERLVHILWRGTPRALLAFIAAVNAHRYNRGRLWRLAIKFHLGLRLTKTLAVARYVSEKKPSKSRLLKAVKLLSKGYLPNFS
jgi:hypothetical protein